MKSNRRKFIKQVGMGTLGAVAATALPWDVNADTIVKSSYVSS